MATCALTQGYNLDCKDSVGGIKTVYIMEQGNIVSLISNSTVGTGSITASTSSPNVTGTGTAFLSQVKIGDLIYQGATLIGTVLTITSDTALVLAANSTTLVSGLAFSIQSGTGSSGTITSITKATGKKFFQYNLPRDGGSFDDSLETSVANGTTHSKQMVKFVINKLSASVRNEILLLAKNRLAMVVVDNNGNAFLFGQVFGMDLAPGSKVTSGTKLGDRAGYDLTFQGEEPNLANFVDANTLSTLLTPGA